MKLDVIQISNHKDILVVKKNVCAVYQVEDGRLVGTTDMHFTVMAFNSGTGEPIMCAKILK
jgi:hypothetical protein